MNLNSRKPGLYPAFFVPQPSDNLQILIYKQYGVTPSGNTPCKQTGLKVEFSTKEEESSAMKQSRFTDSQIMAILKQVENGLAVPDVCREHGISVPTFYKWRAKFGGMDASLIARMKELEAENARLKKMYIETQIKNDLLSEALGKKP